MGMLYQVPETDDDWRAVTRGDAQAAAPAEREEGTMPWVPIDHPTTALATAGDIYVIFDGLPGGPEEPATFVEVENAAGEGVAGVCWSAHPSAPGLYRLGPFRLPDTAHARSAAS